MQEKEPLFTVTDRRKFTTEGELRPGVVASAPPPAPAEVEGIHRASVEAAHPDQTPEPIPVAPSDSAQEVLAEPSERTTDGDGMPEPTASESADQYAAYQESSRTLDELVAKQNPAARAAGAMTFDRLVQSVYMTAAMQLGAGGQPGEQPRIDILGARQSIDMLAILGEKTKGNLTDNEQRLLQNALFELRMSFLEITNAIATSAAQGPPPPAAGYGAGLRSGGR